jgi:NAD(P)-dependent dehydrogenase (short-subunit alcohol dehydrogenase family)
VKKVVSDAVERFGEISVLVTAAGFNHALPIVEQELSEWIFNPNSEVYKNFLRRIPAGRFGEPEDFVGPCIFLASSGSDFMTVANVAVEGGYWAN